MSHRQVNLCRALDVICCLTLLTLVLVFFFPILTGHTFTTVAGHHEAVYPWRALGTPHRDVPQSDQADLTYPWRTFIANQLSSGDIPFWNPLSFGGQPLFANGSSGILYAPNLITAVAVSPDWAHDIVSFLHVLLSGVFMYLLMREWHVARPGALLSAVAWMLSSFNMAWLHLEVVAPVSAFLPLAVLLVARAYRRDSWPATVGAAASLACVLISGHLLFCALVYGVAVVYALGLTLTAIWAAGRSSSRGVETIVPSWHGVRDPLTRFGVIVIGPFALGAIVLVPTGLFLTALGRESLPYEAARAAIRVPYRAFQHAFAPPTLPLTEQMMHEMAYVGLLPALFAIIGFFRRGAGTTLARLLVVGVVLVATDTVLLQLAYLVFPKFSFFSPLGRLLNLFCFGVVILAGVGFNAVLKPVERSRALVVLTCTVVGFTGWQLLAYARETNPPFVKRDSQFLYPATPLIDALRKHGAENGTGPGRILPVRQSQRNGWTPPVLYSTESLMFGIDSAGGYDSTLPSRAETVWRVAQGEDLMTVLAMKYRRAFQTSFEIDRVRFDLLPRLGVTTIVGPPGLTADPLWTAERVAPLGLRTVYSGKDGDLFTIEGVTGGPWLVHETEVVADGVSSVVRFVDPSFDHRRSVIIERADLPDGVTIPAAGQTARPHPVQLQEDGVNSLRLAVTSTDPGWLVIPNVWDEGWSAWVNGRKTHVVRANYMFQAVPIAAGTSHINLSYEPPGLRLGVVITLVSMAFALTMLVRIRRSQSRAFSLHQ